MITDCLADGEIAGGSQEEGVRATNETAKDIDPKMSAAGVNAGACKVSDDLMRK